MAKLTFADLFSQGSLCDLDISEFAGLTRTRPEDLGITRSEAIRAALTFGHERLVSKDYLKPIRTVAHEARKLLDENSIPFPLVQGSRYIPKAKRDQIDKQLQKLSGQFSAEVQKFCEGYEAHKKEMLVKIREALSQAARNTDAVNSAMQRIEAQYPSVAGAHSKFSLRWKWFSISPPQDGTLADGESNAVEECLESMVNRLRAEVDEKMTDVLTLVAKGGKLTQKTYNSAKSVCDKIESLNIFGDKKLSEAINKMRQVIDRAANFETDQQKEQGEILVAGLQPLRDELAQSAADAMQAAADRMAGRGARRMSL